MRAKLTILICGLGMLLAGCTRYDVRVTAYLSHDLPFPSPRPGLCVGVVTKSDPEEPLLEAEVKRKIEWLLRDRGYEVGSADECDYMLTAFFAIDRGTTAIGSYPVYEPGRTVRTHVRTCRGKWVTRTTYLPGRTTYEPYSYTYFTRHLGLTLYERERWLAAGEKDLAEVMVWRSNTVSSGSSSDLRRAVNYLLVASFEHFGQDTGQQVRSTLLEGDKRVKSLRDAGPETRP